MVKNYLIGSVRPVIKTWYSNSKEGATADNENWQHHLELYQQMYAISRASAKQYLQGDWQEICHQAPVLDARFFQIAQWYLVKEQWFREPCNILCMGADTMFVKPTDIFDSWNAHMRMFNYTDPRTHPEFPNYFNDDVRYFPHDMDPSVWEIGERRMHEWFGHEQSHWDLGQLINNSMFWSQNIDDSNRLYPMLNFMCQNFRNLDQQSLDFSSAWNRCNFDQAHVLHFNGSRGPADTVKIMQTVAEKYEISL